MTKPNTHAVLSPAYGRTYTDAESIREDWAEGKDFKIPVPGLGASTYINLEDARRMLPEFTFTVNYGTGKSVTLAP